MPPARDTSTFIMTSLLYPVLLFLLGTSTSMLGAAEWQIHRFEGRDYVSLDNIATFYGLPAEIAPLPAPAPPEAGAPAEAILAWNTFRVNLASERGQFEVRLNSREVHLNGAKRWLAFPTHVQEGKILVSRLDLAKIIEPALRPELIPELKPVKTVVLDAGHGGHDKGATCRFGCEKDFTLDVSKRLKAMLETKGFNVVMTRTSDVFIPLEHRPRAANKLTDAIFVSVHFNATNSNPLASGFEIFSITPRGAPSTGDTTLSARDLRNEPGNAVDLPSSALATSIFHSMLGQIPVVDRGQKHARFAVIRMATVPAVLIEGGFVTNAAESTLIGSPSWRTKLAEAIVNGIEAYKDLAENKRRPKLIADYRRIGSGTTGNFNVPSLTITPAEPTVITQPPN